MIGFSPFGTLSLSVSKERRAVFHNQQRAGLIQLSYLVIVVCSIILLENYLHCYYNCLYISVCLCSYSVKDEKDHTSQYVAGGIIPGSGSV